MFSTRRPGRSNGGHALGVGGVLAGRWGERGEGWHGREDGGAPEEAFAEAVVVAAGGVGCVAEVGAEDL